MGTQFSAVRANLLPVWPYNTLLPFWCRKEELGHKIIRQKYVICHNCVFYLFNSIIKFIKYQMNPLSCDRLEMVSRGVLGRPLQHMSATNVSVLKRLVYCWCEVTILHTNIVSLVTAVYIAVCQNLYVTLTIYLTVFCSQTWYFSVNLTSFAENILRSFVHV